jgi:hypothetical protein
LVENEFKEYRFEAEELESLSFEYNGETYYITINEIGEESADIVIEPGPTEVTLYIDRAENVDIDADGSIDTRIILQSIQDNKAKILVRVLGAGVGSITGDAIKVLPYKGPNPYYLIPTILLLIIFIVLMSVKKTHLSAKKKKFITVLDVTLMGLIFLLFLSAVVKKLPVGAFLGVGEGTANKITISAITIAFALAAISIGMILVEKKKIKDLNRKEKNFKLKHVLNKVKIKRRAKTGHKPQHHAHAAKKRQHHHMTHHLKKIYKL